jgi:PAS domain-containing protein
MPLRKVEIVEHIKKCLKSHPRGITIREISKYTGMNRNLVAKYLDLLQISGIVEMEAYGVAKAYFLSKRVPISAILDFSSDYIISFDNMLRVCQVNDRLLTLLNEKKEDLLGKYLQDIDSPIINELKIDDYNDILYINDMKKQEINVVLNGIQSHFRVNHVPCVFNDGARGLTCVIEDITIQRIYEEERENHLTQIEFFSRKLQDFIELPLDTNIYMAIGAGLDELIPNTIIDVNSYDSVSQTLKLKAIYGARADEFVQKCREKGFSWEAAPAYDIVTDVLKAGKIFHLPGKLHYASFKQISETDSADIEKEFNLWDFYSIGLNWRGNLLGNITFIMQKDAPNIDIPLIEIYARAASIILQRHIDEKKFHES